MFLNMFSLLRTQIAVEVTLHLGALPLPIDKTDYTLKCNWKQIDQLHTPIRIGAD